MSDTNLNVKQLIQCLQNRIDNLIDADDPTSEDINKMIQCLKSKGYQITDANLHTDKEQIDIFKKFIEKNLKCGKIKGGTCFNIIRNRFKRWYCKYNSNGNKKIPTKNNLKQYFEKLFGEAKGGKWHNIRLVDIDGHINGIYTDIETGTSSKKRKRQN